MFEFKDLIDRYSVNLQIQHPHAVDKENGNDLEDYDELGNAIKVDVPLLTTIQGALIPINARAIYNSGGRLTEADRTLYCTVHNIPIKSKVYYKGFVYQVISKVDLEDYADFSQYTLKGVDAFG